MRQLALPISARLTYSTERFVEHAGVRTAFSRLASLGEGHPPTIFFVHGTPRSGKTHFSVALFDRLSKSGRYPTFLPNEEFLTSLNQRARMNEFKPGDIFLVDDADEGLLRATRENSGPAVAAFESVRHTGGSIILFSRRTLAEINCDDHVLSRLRGGEVCEIGPPDEADVSELLRAMSYQRGIRLGEREMAFMLRRLRRDIRSLEHYFERLMHLADLLGVPIKRGLLAKLGEL